MMIPWAGHHLCQPFSRGSCAGLDSSRISRVPTVKAANIPVICGKTCWLPSCWLHWKIDESWHQMFRTETRKPLKMLDATLRQVELLFPASLCADLFYTNISRCFLYSNQHWNRPVEPTSLQSQQGKWSHTSQPIPAIHCDCTARKGILQEKHWLRIVQPNQPNLPHISARSRAFERQVQGYCPWISSLHDPRNLPVHEIWAFGAITKHKNMPHL
jgi:hypothetical protein